MPKEVAHWVIAERVRERLATASPAISSLADAVRNYPNCLYLGAVFHDVGYYARGAEGHALEALADRLHGAQGEDTNKILHQLSPALTQIQAKPWLASFLVGVVTHILADRQLHPLVYYFTGNYYERDPLKKKRAATAHRRLEGLMDLRLAGGLKGVKRFSLRRILRDLEVPVDDLVGEVAGQLEPEDAPVSAAKLLEALRFFSKVQWLVRRPLMVKILGLPLRVSPANRENLYSLTYFAELESFMDLLTTPLEFRNPSTGELRRESLEGAVETIVDATLAWCADFPHSLAGLPRGASLEVGVASVATADAEYFHPYVLAQDYKKIANFEMLRSLT